MKLKLRLHLLLLLFTQLLFIVTVHAQFSCCKLPDSLKVTTVTDSSFCVQWHAKDTSQCDTAKAFQIRYKRVGTSAWKYTKKRYNGVNICTFCDTVKPCTEYKWQVRNICIHSGDSTFTDWATGPQFTTICDTVGFSKLSPVYQFQQLHQLNISPNPAQDRIVITGKFTGLIHINVTNLNGTIVVEKTLTITGHRLQTTIDISALKKSIYFITINDKTGTLKQQLVKN